MCGSVGKSPACQWRGLDAAFSVGFEFIGLSACDPEAVPDGIRFRVTSFRVLIQNKNWVPIIWLFDMR